MPCSLYCASVHDNPRCDSTASRLSLRPVTLSGSVTLDGSRLSSSPDKLNASGYSSAFVASVQIPDVLAAGCTPWIDPDASITRSMRAVCKGTTKTVAPEDSPSCWTSPDKRYRP